MLADNITTCGDDDCKPGCACPDDMVESKGKCIQKEECACYHMPTKEWYKVSRMIHACSISSWMYGIYNIDRKQTEFSFDHLSDRTMTNTWRLRARGLKLYTLILGYLRSRKIRRVWMLGLLGHCTGTPVLATFVSELYPWKCIAQRSNFWEAVEFCFVLDDSSKGTR